MKGSKIRKCKIKTFRKIQKVNKEGKRNQFVFPVRCDSYTGSWYDNAVVYKGLSSRNLTLFTTADSKIPPKHISDSSFHNKRIFWRDSIKLRYNSKFSIQAVTSLQIKP